MSKRAIIECILSLLLVVYLAVMLPMVWNTANADPYTGLRINIESDSCAHPFLSEADINKNLGNLARDIATKPRTAIDNSAIERAVKAMDCVEDANVVALNDGSLAIDVIALRPVARIFDPAGKVPSYYINRAGKRMAATPANHVDVPVILGTFNAHSPFPAALVPVIDNINQYPEAARMISALSVDAKDDIYIMPTFRGHVVNFGDTTNVHNKLSRLLTFYRKVMPVKGWMYYDTVSVKWNGQVVGHRRVEPPPRQFVEYEDIDDIDDPGTMLPDSLSQNPNP